MLTYSVLVIVFILLISICSVVFGAKPIDQCKARMNDMKGAKLELACIELLDIEKMVNDETSIEVCYYSGGALRADGLDTNDIQIAVELVDTNGATHQTQLLPATPQDDTLALKLKTDINRLRGWFANLTLPVDDSRWVQIFVFLYFVVVVVLMVYFQ
jgi:hypothetical protein